jgi:mRNA-degrading endonuclease RelE of RelBE toxin-antitoxin system
MAYDLEFTSSAVGDLEKLIRHNPALAVRLIAEHVPAIVRDPKAVGETKRGDLSGLRAYGFTFRGVVYRLAYRVDDTRRLVLILAIGVHDEAYRRARDRR